MARTEQLVQPEAATTLAGAELDLPDDELGTWVLMEYVRGMAMQKGITGVVPSAFVQHALRLLAAVDALGGLGDRPNVAIMEKMLWLAANGHRARAGALYRASGTFLGTFKAAIDEAVTGRLRQRDAAGVRHAEHARARAFIESAAADPALQALPKKLVNHTLSERVLAELGIKVAPATVGRWLPKRRPSKAG